MVFTMIVPNAKQGHAITMFIPYRFVDTTMWEPAVLSIAFEYIGIVHAHAKTHFLIIYL